MVESFKYLEQIFSHNGSIGLDIQGLVSRFWCLTINGGGVCGQITNKQANQDNDLQSNGFISLTMVCNNLALSQDQLISLRAYECHA